MTKTMKETLNKKPWLDFTRAVQRAEEDELREALVDEITSDKPRPSYVSRVYHRLSQVRRKREMLALENMELPEGLE